MKILNKTIPYLFQILGHHAYSSAASLTPRGAGVPSQRLHERGVQKNDATQQRGLPRKTRTEELQYDIVLAGREHRSQVLELMRRTFFMEEPVFKATGFTGQLSEELEQYCMHSLDDGVSLMALHRDTGALLSVSINAMMDRSDDEGNAMRRVIAASRDNRTRCALRFWATLTAEADVWGQYPDVDCALDVRYLATCPTAQGHGLARALSLRSESLARERGFPMLRIDCTSIYSEKIAKRLGMTKVYALQYKNFECGGEHSFRVEPPHTEATVYVKLLQE